MDNASFHRKEVLKELSKEAGIIKNLSHSLLYLCRSSISYPPLTFSPILPQFSILYENLFSREYMWEERDKAISDEILLNCLLDENLFIQLIDNL